LQSSRPSEPYGNRREANRLQISLDKVEVKASARFESVGLAASNICYCAKVASPAGAAVLAERRKDGIAATEVVRQPPDYLGQEGAQRPQKGELPGVDSSIAAKYFFCRAVFFRGYFLSPLWHGCAAGRGTFAAIPSSVWTGIPVFARRSA